MARTKAGGVTFSPNANGTDPRHNTYGGGVTAQQGNNSLTGGVTYNTATGAPGVGIGASTGVQAGDIRYGVGAGISTTGPSVNAGAQGQTGNTTYGLGATVSPQGVGPNANVGYANQEGNLDYNAGISTSSGATVGVGTRQGDNRYGVSTGPTGMTGNVQFGQGSGNRGGAQVGGAIGSTIGSAYGPVGTFVGGAIGSAVGSVAGGAFNPGSERKEHNVRNSIISSLDETGMWDKKTRLATNPDGSTYDFSNTGRGGEHTWADPTRRSSEHTGTDQLFSYETDYTNDLDYTSNMVGNSLARILAGGANKGIDQFGGQLGNSFLGASGYGAKMDEKTFANTMTNARAYYAKIGISTKEDMLGLANKLYADQKIKDEDYAVMQQSAAFVFDNDYATASKLMSGRDKGIEAAGKTPADSMGAAAANMGMVAGGNKPASSYRAPGAQGSDASIEAFNNKYGRAISPEEAWAYSNKFADMYINKYGLPKARGGSGSSTMATIGAGLTAIPAIVRGGQSIYNGIRGSGGSSAEDNGDYTLDPNLDYSNTQGPEDYTLDPNLDYTQNPTVDLGADLPQDDYTFDPNLDYVDYVNYGDNTEAY